MDKKILKKKMMEIGITRKLLERERENNRDIQKRGNDENKRKIYRHIFDKIKKSDKDVY